MVTIVTFQLSESESNSFLVVDKELVDERNPPVIDETLESSKKQDKLRINDIHVPKENQKNRNRTYSLRTGYRTTPYRS